MLSEYLLRVRMVIHGKVGRKKAGGHSGLGGPQHVRARERTWKKEQSGIKHIRRGNLKCNRWVNVEVQLVGHLEKEILKMIPLKYLVFHGVLKLKNPIRFHLCIVRYNYTHTHAHKVCFLLCSFSILYFLLKKEQFKIVATEGRIV